MTSQATIRELFEPVLTLTELADYLHVPAQTIYDLRASPWALDRLREGLRPTASAGSRGPADRGDPWQRVVEIRV